MVRSSLNLAWRRDDEEPPGGIRALARAVVGMAIRDRDAGDPESLAAWAELANLDRLVVFQALKDREARMTPVSRVRSAGADRSWEVRRGCRLGVRGACEKIALEQGGRLRIEEAIPRLVHMGALKPQDPQRRKTTVHATLRQAPNWRRVAPNEFEFLGTAVQVLSAPGGRPYWRQR